MANNDKPEDKHPLDDVHEALKRATSSVATFKERYPASVFKGLGVKDPGPEMDKAFSNPEDEYKLGTGLRGYVSKLGGQAR